jgi:hypothetical protein
MRRLIIYISLVFLFSSCEDVIDVDLDQGKSQLVVDALLTNDSSLQIIRLTKSADYFLNAPTPAASGAIVSVLGPNGKTFTFANTGNGSYTYDPNTNGRLDSVGFMYQLNLVYENRTYISTSLLNPVPPIDSITYSFEENELGQEDGYYAQFWATDFFGRKDFYYIRAFKNGITINPDNPSSLILSEDAAFGGNGADGFPFILPIRASITNGDDPFALGDISSVELLSMNRDAYEFLEQVTIQANNGGLFSTPPANIKSNIKAADGSSQDEVLGVFSLSSISKNSIQITQ